MPTIDLGITLKKVWILWSGFIYYNNNYNNSKKATNIFYITYERKGNNAMNSNVAGSNIVD